MRRFAGSQLGLLENFQFEHAHDPVPGPGEVRIRNHVVALGFVDGLITSGRYQMQPDLPFTPGGEIGGVVDMVGPGVRDLHVGARVVTWQLGGGLADYAVVAAEDVDIVPDELALETAAAALVDYQTARYALLERGRLMAGEIVLVAGATGGVGAAAVQYARNQGARVIALASDLEKGKRALDLGASDVLSPADPDLRDNLRRLAPSGLDIVLDPVGGAISEVLFRSLAKEGRHLVIGFASGTIPAIRSNLALVKSASLVGVDLRYFVTAHPEAARVARQNIFEDICEGKIAPPLIAMFDFQNAREALLATSLRSKIGKPLVSIR